MNILEDKSGVIDNVPFDKYEIRKIEWDLSSLIVGVMVIYYQKKVKFPVKIKTHYFKVGNDVDVNDLIDKVVQLHNNL